MTLEQLAAPRRTHLQSAALQSESFQTFSKKEASENKTIRFV